MYWMFSMSFDIIVMDVMAPVENDAGIAIYRAQIN